MSYFSHIALTDYCQFDPVEPYCWVDMHDGGANYNAGGEYSEEEAGAWQLLIVVKRPTPYLTRHL